MPVWLAITLAVAAPVFSVVAALITVSFVAGRRFAVIETTQGQHSDALKALPDTLRAFVSKEEGRGYQAQLDRLERNDAECDGKIAAMRLEFDARAERVLARVTSHEQSTNTQNTAQTTAIAELRATITGLKESIDRFAEAERQRAVQQQPAQGDFLTQLQQFVQLQKMLKATA